MTKINKIVIHGFKSFAHRTEVPFDSKFNCILGPNGSGKSNIGDALCFVLGRLSAKSMRAEKGANLIFNGGKNKKPASQGTVEIIFSNQDKTFPEESPEINVSRTITNNGNSVYRINDKKKTRQEVVDYLALGKINPDGYNIILQGDITRFVEMSPLERRKIIEEISDVSVYEEKKNKALLELQKVEEKLNNAEIILKERKTYLRELKKDRDQALEFKGCKDKIDSCKATYLSHQIKEREEVKGKFDEEVSRFQKGINDSEVKINERREKINEAKKEIGKINEEIERKGEKEQVRVHREIEDLKVNAAKEKTRLSTIKDEINKIEVRKDKFSEELKELEEKQRVTNVQHKEILEGISKRKKEVAELEENIAQFKKKHSIETSHELEKELDDKDKLIEQKQEEVQKIRLQQQDLLREKDKLEYQMQSMEDKVKKVKEVEEQNKEQLKILQQEKNNFKSATLRLNQLLDLDSSFAAQLSNGRKKLVDCQEQQAKLNAKTLSLQAGLSANEALKSILENKKKFEGVHGTISELGQVNKKYALALESAAGARLQHLVVEDDKTAAECINYLKVNKLGIAAFIPLNKIRSQEVNSQDKDLVKTSGVHDFAINLISFKPQYKKAFSYVFGNTLVVEDIEVARKVGIGRIKMTTLDGNSAEESGVMRGGFMMKRQSVGFKEKDSLEELERIEKEMADLQSVISSVEIKRQANEMEISSLRTLKAELEGKIITMEKTLHLDSSDLEASSELRKTIGKQLEDVNEKVAQVQRTIVAINRDLANLKSAKQMLRSQVNELRNPRLLAQLQAFEESRQKARENLVQLESELKSSTMASEQMLAPEREKILEILKQHEKEAGDFSSEIKRLSISLDQNEKVLFEKEKESKDFYAKYHALFNSREKLNSDISKAENEIETMREKMRSSEREVNLVSLKNAEVKAKLAGLQEEFLRFQNVELLHDKTIEELKADIVKFESLLSSMSAVNMKALEIYEQVEAEYNNLMVKKDGLEKEKTDVLTLMNEIETKKLEHFMKTFNDANKGFSEIFSNLFKKGKAYLQLENPQKPFEDGLSVKVKLTGNRFMDIKSLSGGEKTLTALSFIFAIQEYQPASFYILDEIDAALDKQNAETLSKLIKSYSEQAQYVVISHNDALISEADTLFGVSMIDGVSKVTSLRI